jgi:hypothetical protein
MLMLVLLQTMQPCQPKALLTQTKVSSKFLEVDLTVWAMMNPKKWRNNLGTYMFRSGIAFGKAKDDKLTHNMIIIHLRKVFIKCDNPRMIIISRIRV